VARIAIGDMDIQAHMIDLSQGGLAIATSYNIPQGAILSLRFDLTKMDEKGMASFYQTVKVAGEVRSNIKLNNKDEYRLGISFKKIDEEDKAIIAESVNMSLGR
jgi:c-di-GMP-binding flagellar brake protein YcgR